jgi:dihydrodipicolinate synthase/N-acetylneuraminate lyase
MGAKTGQGIRTLVDLLIEGGIDGLFPLGTSGEFALLTHAERREVIEAVVDSANGRVPVFPGVSDSSTENVLLFSRDARDAGVDGVVATQPYYFTITDEALLEHFALVSEKVDPLPLMLYNILTGPTSPCHSPWSGRSQREGTSWG